MALDKKKSGFSIENRIKNNLFKEDTDTDKYTDEYTYTDTPKKETKSKRLYLLAKPSVHQKLDEYAKANGDTFNNLVHSLMEQFIEDNNL